MKLNPDKLAKALKEIKTLPLARVLRTEADARRAGRKKARREKFGF